MKHTFSQLIDTLYTQKEYRPVSVAVLYREVDSNRKFLLIQSTKCLDEWSFPQGGVEESERLEDALSRELTEELGINFSTEVSRVRLAYHYELLDAESTRKDKRGFSKGKAYFFTVGQYTGNGLFLLQDEEVNEALWMNYENALLFFRLGRPKKADLSIKALDAAIVLLDQVVSAPPQSI